jgi:hypothetical protein
MSVCELNRQLAYSISRRQVLWLRGLAGSGARAHAVCSVPCCRPEIAARLALVAQWRLAQSVPSTPVHRLTSVALSPGLITLVMRGSPSHSLPPLCCYVFPFVCPLDTDVQRNVAQIPVMFPLSVPPRPRVHTYLGKMLKRRPDDCSSLSCELRT